jgi:hypothetical protein
MDCPNIVVGDLTLYLDAGFPPSYPKSGIKWNNISGTVSITAGLQNGPTFNSDFYGSIVFDGSDDYADSGIVISFPHNSAWSIQFIVKTISFVNTYPGYLIQGNAASSGVLIFYISDGTLFWKHNNSGYYITTITFGNVYDIAITYSGSGNVKAYVNGVFVANVGTMASTDSTNSLLLGRGDQFSNHSQYTFLRYSRELSAAEVLQNYYAGLQRFIPTNGLVLWLDGTNTNTRVITPTTAIDMSGNDYNGAFINGTTLNHRDGGTVFNFDGTNDYINVAHDTSQNLTSQGTISSWINPAILTQGWYAGIVAKNTGGAVNQQSYTLSWRQVSGGILGQICNGDGTYNEVYASFPTVANVWYNIVFTWNGSQLVMYNNGVVAGTTTQTINNQILSTDITIGGYTYKGAGGGDEYFNGKIGDVRIYNRGLTATEVLTIYTAGRSRYGL